ncbi:hypothetical protein Tco_0405471 [Tanacetum coccineum]
MAALKFASSHNMVAFLDKSTESDGFEQIVDFLNAHPIKYALTVNPTIYTACIEQFWATAKTSIRSDLQLEDAEGTECLPNATIFEQLTLMGAKTTAWNEFSSTMASVVICLATNQKFNFSKYIFENMVKNLEGGVKFIMYSKFVQVFLDKQVEGMSKHKEIYVTPSYTKKVFTNIKRQEKDFSSRDTPLFPTIIVQAQEQVEPITDDTENVASVPTHSNNPLLSGDDRLKLNELMELCTSLSQRVLDLEKTKTSQAAEIIELKERVKKLEKKGGLDNQSIERDRLIGIGFVLNFVKFISFTFGDKEMISVIEAIIREVFVKLLLDSFGKLSISGADHLTDLVNLRLNNSVNGMGSKPKYKRQL